ncbi:hypothetical protein SORBI_3007G017100 [Sorghum bicolor]|jgi:hypothetical protein|uniref:Uncharacterized protein n=1 Tax=Sorghum bicolor TaxID=4558 RepID=A0A1B6PF20_SORBI|nr:hypothetical protein SORBI_3007G017100 [Sorghum bicolor]
MERKKMAIWGAEAEKKRAISGGEAAPALAKAMVAAAPKGKAIVPSPVPISICGLREAQILAVNLAPAAVVKVCSVAAKDASALFLLLDRQRVRNGWKVAGEDLRALEALSLAYLLVSTAIEAHHPVVSDNIGSTENRGYLVALKEWSLIFEDVAACVPSIGDFNFFAEARNISRLARKVVVKGLNGKGDLKWFGTRLENIDKGLVTLMNCIVNFPVTVKEMKAAEKSRKKAEKERRKKAVEGMRKKAEAEARVTAAATIPVAAAAAAVIIPEGAVAALALVPSPVATEIWGLRAAFTLSISLVSGSTVKLRAVVPKHAMALHTLLSSQQRQGSWFVFEDDLIGLNNVDTSYMLLNTALETHHAIFSSLTRQDLADHTGYVVAFSDWVRDFESRAVGVPSEGAFNFSVTAAELCNGVRELLVEAGNCSRPQHWFQAKLGLLAKTMKTLMETTVYFPAETRPQG